MTWDHGSVPTDAPDPRPGSGGARPTPPWRYAIGMLGTSIPINAIKSSMLYFYVEILGMDGAAYAAVYSVYGIIDAIDNPVFGYISDRTRTRWGRRRPYLVGGALVLLVAMVALFWVPDVITARRTTALVAWFAVFAILSEMADSLINANYGALLPELFPAEKQRALANTLRQGFQLVAVIVATGLTPLLARDVLGCEAADAGCTDPTGGYRILAVVYGIVATAVILFMVAGIHEVPGRIDEHPPGLLGTFVQILTNRYFWGIGAVYFCIGASAAMIVGGLQFYVTHTLGGGARETTLLEIAVVASAGAFLAGWTAVVRRRGAAWVWRAALPLTSIAACLLFLADSLPEAIGVGVFLAAGASGLLASNDLMLARVLDEDVRRTGLHREGVFLSAFGVLGRLAAIPASLALVSLNWFFGYQSGAHPGPDPALAWRVYLTLYPAALMAIATVISRFIRIPEDTPLAP